MSSPREIGVQWFQQVWNERKSSAIYDLFAEDGKGHLEGGLEITGPAAFDAFQQSLLKALPDIKIEILNSLSDGDDACILWQAHATHTGHGLDLPPSGNPVKIRGITWFHIENGKIVEGWDSWDIGGLMQTMRTPA